MDKTTFITIMTCFMRKRKENEEWLDKVQDCFYGAWEPILNHNYEDLFVETLVAAMSDTDEWIPYFIYEKDCEWFDYEEGGETKTIDNFGKLYDLIVGKED